jgi:hypothetical protein
LLQVRSYTQDDRVLWDAFNAGSKNGTFLFRRGYMEYHADRFADASAIVSDADGRTVALFPANRTGDRIVSHGGLSYGGMIIDEAMTTSRSLDVLRAWLDFWRAREVNEVIYKTVPPIYHRLPADEDRYALFYHGAELFRREVLAVVQLDDAPALQERRRRGAKKAANSGLVVRETSDIEAFWRVLEANLMERHQVRPVHTAAEIRQLQDCCPENIRLFAVFAGDTVRAGTLLYCAGPAVHAQYIGSDEDARSMGALDLLFTTLLQEFVGKARYFDFGNSNENEGRNLNRGLADFKEGFGARAICQDFYRLRIWPG